MVAPSVSTSSQSPFVESNESVGGWRGLEREERGGEKRPALALALASESTDDGEILPRPCWM